MEAGGINAEPAHLGDALGGGVEAAVGRGPGDLGKRDRIGVVAVGVRAQNGVGPDLEAGDGGGGEAVDGAAAAVIGEVGIDAPHPAVGVAEGEAALAKPAYGDLTGAGLERDEVRHQLRASTG